LYAAHPPHSSMSIKLTKEQQIRADSYIEKTLLESTAA
jgi:hypothetical protein